MSVFIAQEWEESNAAIDLTDYATKNELLNYVQKEVDGSVEMDYKKITGLALPSDNYDAANKQYVDGNLMERVAKSGGSVMEGVLNMNGHKLLNIPVPSDSDDAASKIYVDEKSKPVICITAEASGTINAETTCFSFGANSYGLVRGRGYSVGSGVTMPTSGRIKYFTIHSIIHNGQGWATDHRFALYINKMIRSGSQLLLEANIARGSKVYDPPIEVRAGDLINFITLDGNANNFTTTASVFIELDI